MRIQLNGRAVLGQRRNWIARHQIVVTSEMMAVFGIPGIEPCGPMKAGQFGHLAEPSSGKLGRTKCEISSPQHGYRERRRSLARGSIESNLHIARLEPGWLGAA